MNFTKVKRRFIRLRKKIRKPKYKILKKYSLPENGVILVDINYPRVLYIIVKNSKIEFYDYINGSNSNNIIAKRVRRKLNLKSYNAIYIDTQNVLIDIDVILDEGKLLTSYNELLS